MKLGAFNYAKIASYVAKYTTQMIRPYLQDFAETDIVSRGGDPEESAFSLLCSANCGFIPSTIATAHCVFDNSCCYDNQSIGMCGYIAQTSLHNLLSTGLRLCANRQLMENAAEQC